MDHTFLKSTSQNVIKFKIYLETRWKTIQRLEKYSKTSDIRNFNLLQYSLFQNKFESHWVQRTGPYHGIF